MKKVIFTAACWLLLSPFVSAEDNKEVWESLTKLGAVVVLRHSNSPKEISADLALLEECEKERNLNDDGRFQADAVGRAFEDNGITVGTVYASPTCRTRETGIIAFGDVEDWEALKGSKSDEKLLAQRMVEITKRISEHSETNPIVLVTHGSVVQAFTGHSIEMGEFVVMLPSGKGKYKEAASLLVTAESEEE